MKLENAYCRVDRVIVYMCLQVELCRGLLSLVQEKVASDASRLLYDDMLFCHLVEEVLQFEKELRSNQSYPAELPGLLHLLLEDATLQKWLIVEKKSKSLSIGKLAASQCSDQCFWSPIFASCIVQDQLHNLKLGDSLLFFLYSTFLPQGSLEK